MTCAVARAVTACGSAGRLGARGRRNGLDGAFGCLEGHRGAFIRREEERAPVAVVVPLALVALTAVMKDGGRTFSRRGKQIQEAGVRRGGRRHAFSRRRK